MGKIPTNKLSIAKQEGLIKAKIRFGKANLFRNKLVWKGDITPTLLSQTYSLKVTFSFQNNEGVKVFVTNPKPLP